MYGLKYWIHFVFFGASIYRMRVLLFQFHYKEDISSPYRDMKKYLISIIVIRSSLEQELASAVQRNAKPSSVKFCQQQCRAFTPFTC